MKKYKNWSPTGNDVKGLNLKEKQEWFVAPVIKTRDASNLEKCNYEYLYDKLEEIDPDQETWDNPGFNHWACGWFDIIIVKPETKAFLICEEIESMLEDDNCLDRDKLTELDEEDALFELDEEE